MVYIVEGRKARLVPVEVGISTWNYIEIKKGLKEADMIIINPDTPGLKDGGRVEVVNTENR